MPYDKREGHMPRAEGSRPRRFTSSQSRETMSGRAVFSEGDAARPNDGKPTSGARMQD